MSLNKSVQSLNLGWNEKRFREGKVARQVARRSVYRAATVLLNSQAKILESQNDEIRHEINRCYADLQKYDDKLQTLDNMTQLATQSLEVYFQKRMENLRSFVNEQCRIISDGIQEEADHWTEIHAMLQQKLVVPGDLRSYGGGNGLPRAVKQSPNVSQIAEEDECENDVSTLLQSRSLTPLITQTLKKARLLASKLSQDTSTLMAPNELNVSTTAPPPLETEDNHMTLRDVSVIEKEEETPSNDLSVSLLPYFPTTNPTLIKEEEEDQQEKPTDNKSIVSTISDKTFVKSSLKGFSSDEDEDEDEEDDDDQDETVMEQSFIADLKENGRPLVFTADRSIRRTTPTPIAEPTEIKAEKVSYRPPPSSPRKTFLLNVNTFDTENTSNITRPTIVIDPEPIDLPKRRATRRATIRFAPEEQQENMPPPPPKTRYATRSSTRLAAGIREETTVSRTSTARRRTTRLSLH